MWNPNLLPKRPHLLSGTSASFVGNVRIFHWERQHLSLGTSVSFAGNVRIFCWERPYLLLGTSVSFAGNVRIFRWARSHLLLGTSGSFAGNVRIFYRRRPRVYLTATLISPIMLFFIRSTLRWSDFFSSFSSRGLIGSTISSQARGYLSRWLVIK